MQTKIRFRKQHVRHLFFAAALAWTSFSFAELVQPTVGDLAKATEDYIYNDYDQIQKQDQHSKVNLLQIEKKQIKFPLPAIKYDRVKQFGGWINFKEDSSCLDTRGLALKRDSVGKVDVVNCRVIQGRWIDPYTDKTFEASTQIQIDHVVPLKHAYMSGAFEWTQQKRCQFANYLGNDFHLRSVNGTENMKKGDRSPREYMPPNPKFTCEYIKNWLEIKYLWNLRLTPKESVRVKEIVAENACDKGEFLVDQDEISTQKKLMKDSENICIGAVLSTFE